MAALWWKRVKEIVFEAMHSPAEERDALLDQRCGDDEALRSEVVRWSRETGVSKWPRFSSALVAKELGILKVGGRSGRPRTPSTQWTHPQRGERGGTLLRSVYAACFSVRTGRCFLPWRNSRWTCTWVAELFGARGEAHVDVLGHRGRGSNRGRSHAGGRS